MSVRVRREIVDKVEVYSQPAVTVFAMAGIAGGVAGGVPGTVFGTGNRPNVQFMREDIAAPVPMASMVKFKSVEPAAAARVRSYFPEALYINPEIITDQNGLASISIPLADSITTWRMAMMASTVHGALGSGTSSIKVFQDFFVDLDLPVHVDTRRSGLHPGDRL